ncbi:transcriptional regulator, GntR family [Pseudooceanicola antarcticus]|uniref:GntR family transcriptional regulator n=1 Tax=Pseudooceanicola antarcticus TaxID=1247613 RepID=A0A285JJE7_9RHOB|nr:GntR family transcriptional regulator [Pseudooceanicola antarcticus]PJE26366.1 GntR family transcriptional regulator [Pseudooceanicola antarcticus]SNY59221.1 transcriptional regulator, GntR family [Pseudooceanicola antarcticus]
MEEGAAREGLSSEGIAAQLRVRILEGAYSLGQRLIEMDLAEEFGVGRGRVREAFRMLTGEGYLEFVANRGVLVRCYTRAELIEMGRVREVLEGLAAKLAAEAELSGEMRQELEALQERMNVAEAAGDYPSFGAENRAYHALIERLAGNKFASAYIDRVRIPLIRVQMPPADVAESIGRSNRDHRVITAAILNGAPEAAEAAMRAHVRAGNEHVARLPEAVFSAS